MSKELHDSLKRSELNSFIILYALRDYLTKYKTDKELPEFVHQLEELVEKYDRRCTNILIKRNLISGEVDANS
jgi:hypothetical protein